MENWKIFRFRGFYSVFIILGYFEVNLSESIKLGFWRLLDGIKF
jgi:hypothetical protein